MTDANISPTSSAMGMREEKSPTSVLNALGDRRDRQRSGVCAIQCSGEG